MRARIRERNSIMKTYLLPGSGFDYKANLHCHTTVSDGKFTPEEIREQYKSRGYSIIAYTDHDVLIPHHDLAQEDFLPLVGFEVEVNEPMEANPVSQARRTCHMCMIALEPDNVIQPCWHRSRYQFGNAVKSKELVQFDDSKPDYVRQYSGEGISEMMNIMRENGFFVTYNHPTWSQESYPQYTGYKGMNAMEMVNGACIRMGYEDHNERVYNDILRTGNRIFCIAADDTHNAQDLFRGYTVIRAEKLEYRTVTAALEKGSFYCSEGPAIHDLWVEDGRVYITCSDAREVRITRGVRRAGNVVAKDAPVTAADFALHPDDRYFYLTVEDAAGRKAYTNAYFVETLL